jgi:hypothetical protein
MRVLASLLLLFSAGLEAQDFAQVFGAVRDSSEAVVPGAVVTAVNQATGIRRLCRSNHEGSYIIASLQPGIYKMTVRRDGFQTVARLGLRFEIAQNAQVDFVLQVGGTEQEITVDGGPAPVNLDDGSVGMVMGRRMIEALPQDGRNLVGLLELTPGVLVTPATSGEAGQFTTNGQRANANYFTLDGISANTGVSGTGIPAQFSSGSLPGMTALGSTHNLISIEALDEFRIVTSSFAPEFGRLPGAQVIVTSRSGSNEFHGAAYESLRNEAFSANDWFANAGRLSRAVLRYNNFGGVFGGPVRRNRTFFFTSYEGLRLRQPLTWSAAVPSETVRREAPDAVQPILRAFPRPNGRELGDGLAELTASASRPSRLDAGSVRLDHSIGPRLSVFARYSRTPSETDTGYAQINHSAFLSESVTAGMTALIGPALNNELRVNTTNTTVDGDWRTTNEGGATPLDLSLLPLPVAVPREESFYQLTVAGVGRLITGVTGTNSERQFNLVNTLSFHKGTHQFRFGGDYRRLRLNRGGPPYSVGVSFESLADMVANQNMLLVFSEAERVSSVVRNISFFVQDTWRARPRLTVTYGSRWELNPSPPSMRSSADSDVAAQSTIQVPGRGASLWRMGYSNFGPRLGIAYGLTPDGRSVLRAGAGVYYDAGFSAQADAVNGAPFNSLRMSFGMPYARMTAATTTPVLIQYGVAPGLRLPYSVEWNVSLEHGFSDRSAGSISYVGSAGRALLRREAVLRPDIEAVEIAVATNHGSSDYNALQLQFRRKVSRGLQGMVSYNWSHSLDDVSWSSALQLVQQPGFGAKEDRGPSNFDVRHSLAAAFAYDLPASGSRLTRGWTLHGMFRARTGFPIDVLARPDAFGLSLSNMVRPNRMVGEPLWIDDPNVPGGALLNRAAFSLPDELTQGSLGRNAIGGFGMHQLDLAVRRQFRLSERAAIQFRLEAFNALNHANFGDPVRFLVSPLFGRPVSMLNLMLGSGTPGSGLAPALQMGGPRSLQLGLRFEF